MLARPCLVQGCKHYTRPGKTRCPIHEGEVNRAKHHRRSSAPGDGAAARLRRKANGAELVRCAGCGVWLSPAGVQVDHRVPLFRGGTDTDDNVQLLCTDQCHRAKSATEARERANKQRATFANKPRSLRH